MSKFFNGEVPGLTPSLVGRSEYVEKMRAFASQVARTQHTILLEGDTGVGKDCFAEYIHYQGNPKANIVAVNCGAIPESLLESEFFGHTGHAFTGANKGKKGLIDVAQQGTLFLDEIGELPLNAQTKLLSVLDKKPYRPLGGIESHEVKTRIIAATNVDLRVAVSERRFRKDLFFRLCLFQFQIPRLCEHSEDIPDLVTHFLQEEQSDKVFSPSALRVMEEYHWPGNVRELRNTVIRSIFFSGDQKVIGPDDVRSCIDGSCMDAMPTFYEYSREYFRKILERTRGDQTKGAHIAGIPLKVLTAKIREFELVDFAKELRSRRVQ